MQGNKTHQQQRNIIEGRENTANGDRDLDIRSDLNRSEAAKDAFRRGDDLDMRVAEVSLHDDPAIMRGTTAGTSRKS